MKKYLTIFIGLVVLTLGACKEEEFELGDPPTAADAAFSYKSTTQSDNIIQFTANRSDAIAKWDFGNGVGAEGNNVTATYPNKGTYTVTLTVFTSGGSISATQDVVIVDDDPTLLSDPIYLMLTGGVDSVNGKTWVMDSASAGHFGVGPNPSTALGDIPEWYSAPANDKAGVGMYNDRYTFHLNAFKFDMVTKGEVYVHTDYKDDFAGSFQNKGDYTAPFDDKLGESWQLKFDAGSDSTLTVSGSSFLGFYTGVNTYKIVSISENEIVLRFLMGSNDGLAWYIRLIPEGFVPDNGGGSGGGGTGFALPIDFETEEPDITTFGNSTATVIDNPDKRGINTSNKVLETVHGNEPWAGLYVDLDSDLDFSSEGSIALKVWSNTRDTVRIKIEDQDDNTVFVEKDVIIPVTFTWVEVSVDFSSAASGTYNRLVLLPGWNVANAGTFYLDDFKQQ